MLDTISRTQKSSLAGVPLLPRPRVMENMRYEELWVPGRSGTHGGRPLGRTGLLGTQSKIVLHFISKEMPWEGSIVFKKREAAGLPQAGSKGRAGMLPWWGVEPLGELAGPQCRTTQAPPPRPL